MAQGHISLSDAEVVADDWGGLFKQPAHLPEERDFEFSVALPFAAAPGTAFSFTDGAAPSTEPSCDPAAARAKSDVVERQVRSAGDMPREGDLLFSDTYRILTQSLCRKAQVRTAATLLDEMLHRGIPADPLAYTTVLNSLRRKKQLRGAYRLLCLMRDRGVSPDIVHYNTVIVAMCREGRPLDACKVVGDMVDSGCTPNAVTYATVVSGLCVSGLYDKAEAYLVDMVGKGLVPHFSVFHSVIRGYCTVGKVEEAAQIMSRMLGLGVVPHVESWSPVIRTSVINFTYKNFLEIVYQNNDTTVQTYHIDGYAFWVVGMNYGEWTENSRGTYNKWNGVSRCTTQVFPGAWTAMMLSLDSPGSWNVRTENLDTWYITNLQQTAEGIMVGASVNNGGRIIERKLHCSLLLGADGARSTVRELAGISMEGEGTCRNWSVCIFLAEI